MSRRTERPYKVDGADKLAPHSAAHLQILLLLLPRPGRKMAKEVLPLKAGNKQGNS
jgi:hypothetical protein